MIYAYFMIGAIFLGINIGVAWCERYTFVFWEWVGVVGLSIFWPYSVFIIVRHHRNRVKSR